MEQEGGEGSIEKREDGIEEEEESLLLLSKGVLKEKEITSQELMITVNEEIKMPPPPPVEIKLFVGRVPRTYGEHVLRELFSDFGQVGDVIIIRDRETGVHKGCAFVRMASITSADLAIRSLNNAKALDMILGPLQVKYAAGEADRLGLPSDCGGQDQAKLFVGSLPKGVSEDAVVNVFSRFGSLSEVYLMKDDHRGRSGCAFVKFSHKEEAFHAIANLNGKHTMTGSSRAMEVRFAENKKSQQCQQLALLQSRIGQSSLNWTEYFTDCGRPYYYHVPSGQTQWERPREMDRSVAPKALTPVHAQVTQTSSEGTSHGPLGANLFVFHIPNDWSNDDFLQKFSEFGHIISGRIASDKITKRNKGFGFISYDNVNSALAAVSAMNGRAVNGKRLKVQIKKGEERFIQEVPNREWAGGIYDERAAGRSVEALGSLAECPDQYNSFHQLKKQLIGYAPGYDNGFCYPRGHHFAY